jgi:signal transduction histidine kinase
MFSLENEIAVVTGGASGLGLATVHRIVEANGGNLRVESSVGEGTVLRVCFPRQEETP